MKPKTESEDIQKVIFFLRSKEAYIRKRNINIDGLKQSRLSKILRELRKQKIVRYGMRRWGLNYERML